MENQNKAFQLLPDVRHAAIRFDGLLGLLALQIYSIISETQ